MTEFTEVTEVLGTEITDTLVDTPDVPDADSQIESIPEYKGLALEITAEINKLVTAREYATKLESGLITKSGIIKAATICRDYLTKARHGVAGVYPKVLEVKKTLLETIGEVQTTATRERLEKEAAEIAARLAELNK